MTQYLLFWVTINFIAGLKNDHSALRNTVRYQNSFQAARELIAPNEIMIHMLEFLHNIFISTIIR